MFKKNSCKVASELQKFEEIHAKMLPNYKSLQKFIQRCFRIVKVCRNSYKDAFELQKFAEILAEMLPNCKSLQKFMQRYFRTAKVCRKAGKDQGIYCVVIPLVRRSVK